MPLAGYSGEKMDVEEAGSLLGNFSETGKATSEKTAKEGSGWRHHGARFSGLRLSLLSATAKTPQVTSILKRLLFALLPSFVQSLIKPSDAPAARKYPTSHLDGMRGLAAFFVVCCHMSAMSYSIWYSYGSGKNHEHRSFLQLPIISIIYAPIPQVAAFFVVSGYSLSIKPVKQMRAGQWEGLLDSLASSTFRRILRLYLPCVVSTFLVLVLIRLNCFEYTHDIGYMSGADGKWREMHAQKKATLWLQLQDWAASNFQTLWIWNFDLMGGRSTYDSHLWTIPVEMRGSMILFLCQVAFARKRPIFRSALFAIVFWFFHHHGRWEVCLFLAGAMLVEADAVLSKGPGWHSQSRSIPDTKGLRYIVTHVFWIAVFIFSLYLLTFPEREANTSYFYAWLDRLIPAKMERRERYWALWGAILYAASVNNLKILAAFYNTRLVQYLGKISFALYLVHGPLQHTLGYALQMKVYHALGIPAVEQAAEKTLRFHAAFILCNIISINCFIWAADLFTRAVDVPSVKFARWLDDKTKSKD